MGSLFGGKLSLQGNEVVLYDINKAHVEKINAEGLSIEENSTGKILKTFPLATSCPGVVAGSRLFIIFVKSTATDTVAARFVPFANEDTIVLTLQNGLGNEDILRKHFGRERTAAGVTSQGATFIGPGKIRHAGRGATHICMSDKKNQKLKNIARIFSESGFDTRIEENIANLLWSKLIINAGINALTAITGLENGKLLDYPQMKSLIADLVEEAAGVAEKMGVNLDYPEPVAAVYDVLKKTAMNRSSMLQDFDRGSLTEIDFINGAVVREAEKLGLASPYNSTIVKLVKTMERVNRNKN